MKHLTFYTSIETNILLNNLILAARNSPIATSLYDDGWLTTTTAVTTTAAVSARGLPAAICAIHDATGRYEGGSYAPAVTAVLW